jgi:hypothetical protein
LERASQEKQKWRLSTEAELSINASWKAPLDGFDFCEIMA